MPKRTVDLIIDSSTTFYNELKQDPNGRYRSWEYCYKVFHDARKAKDVDVDYLSLQLAFYLASWGMYRGSSFLLQKDYKIHIPVVEELLKDKYDPLFGIQCVELRKESNQVLLNEISKWMEKYYESVRKTVKETDVKNKVSSTLITKVLMGTFGCVPAYDRYFIDGVKDQKVSTGNYNLSSLLKLVDFYEENYSELEQTRSKMEVCGLPYPQMKVLDMGFWQIGFDKDLNKGISKAH